MHKGTSHKKALRKNESRKGPSRKNAPSPALSKKERDKQDRALGAILTDGFCRQMKTHIDRIRAAYPASRSTLRKAAISRELSWRIRNQYRQQRLPDDSPSIAQGERYVLRRIKALTRKTKSATPSANTWSRTTDLKTLLRNGRCALSESVAMMRARNEHEVPIDPELDGCLPPSNIIQLTAILENEDD